MLQVYTDGYANHLLATPTLHERTREADPGFTAWVSISRFYRGADRLLLADCSVAAEAFSALMGGDGDGIELYASLVDGSRDAGQPPGRARPPRAAG